MLVDSKYSFYTPEEVAEMLKVTPEQIRQLIRKGELTAINVGSGKKRPLYRITSDAISDFINNRHNFNVSNTKKKFRKHTHTTDYFPELK